MLESLQLWYNVLTKLNVDFIKESIYSKFRMSPFKILRLSISSSKSSNIINMYNAVSQRNCFYL